MRILLVEDEESIRDIVRYNLEDEGYEVKCAANGVQALALFQSEAFQLVLLDLMLPEMDGFQVLESIRLENFEIPILILSAREEAEDRIKGLKMGADDYLTKPFVFEELKLRIAKLIKRAARLPTELEIFEFGGNRINFATFDAETKVGPVKLTKKEARLLRLLTERANEVVSREVMLQHVWGYDVYPSTRTVDNFILSFRKYFEPNPKEPIYFHAIRGVGYQFRLEI